MKIFNIKFQRLKIIEQIAIVFFFAVVIPMSISGFIINNINQQSVRHQLRESATLIASMVSDEMNFLMKSNHTTLNEISKSYAKKHDTQLFKAIEDDNRQIYIIDYNRKLIAAHNYTEEAFNDTISHLPENDMMEKSSPVLFGEEKNQPMAYIKESNPDYIVIVRTTEGTVEVDETGKKNGRGAYICKSEECLNKLIKSKRLESIFEMKIDDSVYEEIREIINK
jgi:predicted RNA-binding protein YlxR (DUF448 family)